MLSVVADIASICGVVLMVVTVYLLLAPRGRPIRVDLTSGGWRASNQRDSGTVLIDQVINLSGNDVKRYHGAGVTSLLRPTESIALGAVLGPGEHVKLDFFSGDGLEVVARPQKRFSRKNFDLIIRQREP